MRRCGCTALPLGSTKPLEAVYNLAQPEGAADSLGKSRCQLMIRNALVGRFYTAVFVVGICQRDGEPRLSSSQGNGMEKNEGVPLRGASAGIKGPPLPQREYQSRIFP